MEFLQWNVIINTSMGSHSLTYWFTGRVEWFDLGLCHVEERTFDDKRNAEDWVYKKLKQLELNATQV